MKKGNLMLFLNCIFLSFITINCGSIPREPRSIEATADTINLKAARAIIENYNMEILYDNKSKENFTYIGFPFWDFETKELIIAINSENNDSLVFAIFEHPNKDKFRFCYLSLHGEKTSSIKFDDKDPNLGIVYLNNDAEYCTFNENGHNVVLVSPKDWTKSLAQIRECIEFAIQQSFRLHTFDEPINPKQLELLK